MTMQTTTPTRAKLADTTPLVGVLLTSLEALAAAGKADAACRLAGKACAELRHSDPAAWQRFNVFLHRIIKHVS
ncbi:MAG: hypothetical protein J0H51_01275 [Rhizobiales bacterium]|mgnify:CR=1 FL=1|nr:hypothetical protein [Hyphomicrobiales bacterium]